MIPWNGSGSSGEGVNYYNIRKVPVSVAAGAYGLGPPEHWSREFQSHSRHRCMHECFCVMLSCVGRRLAMGRSPVQKVIPKCLHGFKVSELISESGQSRRRNPRTVQHWKGAIGWTPTFSKCVLCESATLITVIIYSWHNSWDSTLPSATNFLSKTNQTTCNTLNRWSSISL